MSEHSDELVEVIGPHGERKRIPKAAADAVEIRALGFTPVHEIMPPVRLSAMAQPDPVFTQPATDPVPDEAPEEAIQPEADQLFDEATEAPDAPKAGRGPKPKSA